MYRQNYNPTGNVVLSTVVAAIPILVLLYFIAVHPHRDRRGVRHLGVAAPYAAFYGVIAAFVVSCLAFRMPVTAAVSAFALGSLSGFIGIIWIVLAAMFLYTMIVVSGRFEIVKESIVHISFDRRLQVLLIASRSARSSRGRPASARPWPSPARSWSASATRPSSPPSSTCWPTPRPLRGARSERRS